MKNQNPAVGRYVGHARGFGFIETDAAPGEEGGGKKPGAGEDLFVPPDKTGGALHGDTVMYRMVPRRGGTDAAKTHDGLSKRGAVGVSETSGGSENGRRGVSGSRRGGKDSASGSPVDGKRTERFEAEVVGIVSRGEAPKVGTCFMESQTMYVSPLDGRIPYVFRIAKRSREKFALAEGHRVVYSVKRDSDSGDCSIVEILGHVNDPGVDVLSLIKQSGIRYVFSEKVMDEAAVQPQDIVTEDAQGLEETSVNRLDLRGQTIFTIDGADTKDIDDGVSLTRNPDGLYELGVHIADVSHYVPEGGELDKEALRRGNSVYLADRVIPMLPHALSNGICSLNPGADRYAVSCFMTFDGEGRLTGHKIAPSVIRSVKKWTYERVQELLAGQPCKEAEEEFLPIIMLMDELRIILRKKRLGRGALNIESPEAKIRLDSSGRPVSVDVSPHNEATEIIEEFMIACNETVAEHFTGIMLPFVYRSHEPPETEKLKWLDVFVREFGYTLKGKSQSPLSLQSLANAVEGKPEALIISRAILRSMQRASYSTSLPSHYGLASECYCHFTSPIRRYADLQIHRIIKEYWRNGNTARFAGILPEVCAHCSETERAAEALEREVEQLKKVQFMSGREGEVFDGVVTGAVNGGWFVTLPNTVEGFVPKEQVRRERRQKNGREMKPIALGSAVKMKLIKVDEEERKLYFKIKS